MITICGIITQLGAPHVDMHINNNPKGSIAVFVVYNYDALHYSICILGFGRLVASEFHYKENQFLWQKDL